MNTTAMPHSGYSPAHENTQAGREGYFFARNVLSPPIKDTNEAHSFYAQSQAQTPPSTLQKLRGGFIQLFVALAIIVHSILRLARLIVAGTFTLVGLVGYFFHMAGQRIIHPDDRKLLSKLPTRKTSF